MHNERYEALRCLLHIERQGGYSNLVLERLPPELDTRQRAFCSVLVRGVLERRLTLDHILRAHVKRPLEKLDIEVLCILRMGVYQLYYMDGVPASAAVNESVKLCKLCKKTSAGALVNGALRAVSRENGALPPVKGGLMDRLSVQYSAPRPLCRLLCESYSQERAENILALSLAPSPTVLRVNTLRTDAEDLMERLGEEGADCARIAGFPAALTLSGGGSPGKLAAFTRGLFHVQDLHSQLCAQLLDARPGMRVLDVCAAPGGKSFTAAELMEDRGTIVACDMHPHKARLIEQGAQRLGLRCIQPKVQDATEYQPDFTEFDRVLCDVPCSGFGVLSRKPEIKYKKLEELAGLPDLQYKILENSAQYIREGGEMVYSTCTLRPAENEEVVARFLAAHPEFSPGVRDVLGDTGQRTFFPGEDMGEGFYIAVLKKTPV